MKCIFVKEHISGFFKLLGFQVFFRIADQIESVSYFVIFGISYHSSYEKNA